MEFDFSFGTRARDARPPRDDGGPFRLLLIADFSGREAKRARGEVVAVRRPLLVNTEAVDHAVESLDVTLLVGAAGAEELATFRSIGDLHPDSLLARLKVFETPRKLRAALMAPAPDDHAFSTAETWLTAQVGWHPGAPSTEGAIPIVPGATAGAFPAESADATLQRLLGRPATAASSLARTAAAGPADDVMRSLIESVVRPHVIPDVGARRSLLMAVIDEVLTAQMRAILAMPAFRALEGAWRGAERVVAALDTDADLQIALLDACKQDLTEALGPPGGKLEASPLHRLLLGQDQSWSVIAADFTFDLAREDLHLAAALGAIASRAGAPFVAGASPILLGCETLEGLADPSTWRLAGDAPNTANWQALRESPIARFIGLALPRLLMRLPYGKKTDPIDGFAFEELPPGGGALAHHRVWGGAAFAVALAYGAAFRQQGWPMEAPAQLDIDDLPVHTFDDDGESRLVPCTEVGLGERAGTAVIARGIMPILARSDRGAAKLAGLSSIAQPPQPLAGPWLGVE